MLTYSSRVEQALKTFYDSLREKVGCDPKTIRQGQQDLADLPAVPRERCRKKGGDESVV